MATKRLRKRNSTRIPVTNIIYFSDSFEKYDPTEHVTNHVAVTENLSPNGACIFTEQRIRSGRKVKLAFGDYERPPCIATVKWCRRATGQIFRVGLFWPDLS